MIDERLKGLGIMIGNFEQILVYGEMIKRSGFIKEMTMTYGNDQKKVVDRSNVQDLKVVMFVFILEFI